MRWAVLAALALRAAGGDSHAAPQDGEARPSTLRGRSSSGCLLLQVSARSLIARPAAKRRTGTSLLASASQQQQSGTSSDTLAPSPSLRQALAERLAAKSVEDEEAPQALAEGLAEKSVEDAEASQAVSAQPPSQLRQEFVERLWALAEGFGLAQEAPAEPPKRSKVVLMLLEIIPPCGQLGIDRFYIGAWKTGLAKLCVCICTCLVGGLVWGLVDAMIVIMNCLGRDKSIDVFGMQASFTADEVETAHALAVVGVAIQFLTCCATPSALACMRRFVSGEKGPRPPVAGQPPPAAGELAPDGKI